MLGMGGSEALEGRLESVSNRMEDDQHQDWHLVRRKELMHALTAEIEPEGNRMMQGPNENSLPSAKMHR